VTENDEPILITFLKLSDDPMETKFSILMAEPNRVQLRHENVDPRLAKDKTLKVAPLKLAVPLILTELPSRAKLRSDRADPN
jgi:hypothetical protein